MTQQATLHPITQAIFNLSKASSFQPDALRVAEAIDPNNVLRITLIPHMQDIRVLIGRDGRHVQAVTHVARQMGKRFGLAVELDIRESYLGDPAPGRGFTLNKAFGLEQIMPLLRPFLELLCDPVPNVSFEDHGEKGYVIFEVPSENLATIMALGSVFYPFGYRQGRKLSFRVKGLKPEQPSAANEPR